MKEKEFIESFQPSRDDNFDYLNVGMGYFPESEDFGEEEWDRLDAGTPIMDYGSKNPTHYTSHLQ